MFRRAKLWREQTGFWMGAAPMRWIKVKVLFNTHVPFSLAHGGAQIQIEQTQAALEKIGVEVEPLRWWDDKQTGDILQHFGRYPTLMLSKAQEKGMKVVMSDLLTEHGSR